jgi:hypothetical protein
MQQDVICIMCWACCQSPGAFVFQYNMFLNIPLITNLQTIQDRRQVLIDENLRLQNLKCCAFNYVIDQDILNKVPNPAHKLNEKGRRALHHHPSSRQ